MSSTFWSNTIWYILLFFTSIISVVLILYKTKNIKSSIAFLFSILGFSFLIEAILALGLKAYSYHPKIVADIFLDNVFGNYFSQISVSSSSLLIIIFNLSSIWYFIFSLIYFVIEELFLKLGIYQHFWYNSIYTLFGFPFFFWFNKKWYEKEKNSSNNLIHYITLFFSIFAINSLTIILSQRLLGIQIFKGHFFAEMSKDHTTTGLIYQFFQINLLIILFRSKLHSLKKTIVFSCLFFVQYLLYSAGFIYIPKGLFFTVTSLDLLGCYFWIVTFNFFLLSKECPEKVE